MAEEVAHRTQTRIQRCVRRAHFPFLKTIDEYDFTFQTAVRLFLLGSFLGAEFVRPPPGRRIRRGSIGTRASSSWRPRRMVEYAIRVARATKVVPPRPAARASVAAQMRRARSVNVGANACTSLGRDGRSLIQRNRPSAQIRSLIF